MKARNSNTNKNKPATKPSNIPIRKKFKKNPKKLHEAAEKANKSESDLNINWYPGHMKKTKEQIIEHIKLVDVVLEIVDARAPYSSSNPDIDEMIKSLPKVVVLNKEDLADVNKTQKWIEYYKEKGHEATMINAMSGKGLTELLDSLNIKAQGLYEKLENRGRRKRALRVMVVGIPNVGKSSIINRIVGKKSAMTGDRPGVTKGKQWVKLKGDLELLDTPGVLWPKIEDNKVALKLAFLGSIKDQVMEIEEIAIELISYLNKIKPSIYMERFDIDTKGMTTIEIADAIAVTRGYLLPGNKIDYFRLASSLLMEFRAGKLGRITLELPDEINWFKKSLINKGFFLYHFIDNIDIRLKQRGRGWKT